MSGIVSASINPFPTADAVPEAKQLAPDHGYRGILESVTLLGDGFVRAVLSGQPIDLPEQVESKLRPWLGKPTEVANLLGEYYVFQWRQA
jgi:hypothetical protein